MIDKKLIQREAESVVYTCKGLYKTADYYRILYHISTSLSFLIGLGLLVFEVSSTLSKLLGALGILDGIILLMNQKDINDTEEYYKLANKYLSAYKDLQAIYYSQEEDSAKFNDLRDKIKLLDGETSKYNIGAIGRMWSKIRIKSEMDLEWIYEK